MVVQVIQERWMGSLIKPIKNSSFKGFFLKGLKIAFRLHAPHGAHARSPHHLIRFALQPNLFKAPPKLYWCIYFPFFFFKLHAFSYSLFIYFLHNSLVYIQLGPPLRAYMSPLCWFVTLIAFLSPYFQCISRPKKDLVFIIYMVRIFYFMLN